MRAKADLLHSPLPRPVVVVVTTAAKVGLAGRTGFYLLLTVLTARIAAFGGRGFPQDNASGALGLIGRPWIGKAAIAAVAAGFLAFGVGRLIAMARDASVSWPRRATTALQGGFYLVLAWVPVSYLAGNKAAGSEGQQERTANHVMSWPGGPELVVLMGLVAIAVCAFQVRTAASRDFADGMAVGDASAGIRRLTHLVGVVGIGARALVLVPLGVLLIVAGVDSDARHASGLDAQMLALSGSSWGLAVLALVSLGLATFTVYSALETWYRDVLAGR
ncbi:MAG: DUF1206 domain-containing protein [Actinomycetota bacterium]|nr:DUF1206 domain-containing protein [Actinomycetota bacterium]